MQKKDLKFYAKYGDKINGLQCKKCRYQITADDIECPKCGMVFKKRVKELEQNLPRSLKKSHWL